MIEEFDNIQAMLDKIKLNAELPLATSDKLPFYDPNSTKNVTITALAITALFEIATLKNYHTKRDAKLIANRTFNKIRDLEGK